MVENHFTHMKSLWSLVGGIVLHRGIIIDRNVHSKIDKMSVHDSGVGSTEVYGNSPTGFECLCKKSLTVWLKDVPVSVFEHQFRFYFHHILPRYNGL